MQNTRRGKGKVFILLGVLLAVAGLTLGFAAFSNTLTIKSSATVTPSSDTFKVVFSSSDSELKTDEIVPSVCVGGGSSCSETGTIEDLTATNAVINNSGNPTLSGIQVNFTEPNQNADYPFYVVNIGEYDAYLNEVKINNVSGKNSPIVCTAEKDENGNPLATQSLVDDVCSEITVSVYVLGENFSASVSSGGNITPSNVLLDREGLYQAYFHIGYYGESRADGPFTIEIGDIEMVWSTVDVNAG